MKYTMIFRLSNAFPGIRSKGDKQSLMPLAYRILTFVISLFLTGVFWIAGFIFFTPFASAINYNNRILESSDFSRQDLTDSSFDHANLRKSDFSNSNARGGQIFFS